MLKIWVRSLGGEDHLDKEMATHYSILASRISWTEEPDGLQHMRCQRVGQAWATFNFRTSFFQPHFLKKLAQYLISTSIEWLLYTFKIELIRNLDRKMAHLLKESVLRTKKWTNPHKVYLFSNRKTQNFFDAARLNETTSLLRSNPCSFISNGTYYTGPLLHLCQTADRFLTLQPLWTSPALMFIEDRYLASHHLVESPWTCFLCSVSALTLLFTL